MALLLTLCVWPASVLEELLDVSDLLRLERRTNPFSICSSIVDALHSPLWKMAMTVWDEDGSTSAGFSSRLSENSIPCEPLFSEKKGGREEREEILDHFPPSTEISGTPAGHRREGGRAVAKSQDSGRAGFFPFPDKQHHVGRTRRSNSAHAQVCA